VERRGKEAKVGGGSVPIYQTCGLANQAQSDGPVAVCGLILQAYIILTAQCALGRKKIPEA
jgi:hypothetical protein